MTARLSGAVLAVAFAFGIGTLGIAEMWPWALFQSLVLLTAGFVLQSRTVSVSLVLPLFVALIGVVQLLTGNTIDAWQTQRTVLEWITYTAAAFLAFQVFLDPRLRRWALRAFAVFAAAVAALDPFPYHTKLANFAELAMPVAVWLLIVEPRQRWLYSGCAIVLAGSVVASASRGGIVIIGLEAIVLCLLARRPVLVLAIVLCGVALFGWDVAAHRFTTLDPAEDLRWPLAATSIEMAHRYWLGGCGLGTWSIAYPEFARFDLHVFINQAHSDWLQWLDEGGIWFPAIMAAMLAIALKTARREWWTVGLAFVWLHGAIDYPMQQTPAFACLQIAFWGAAVALNSNVSRAVAVGSEESGHLLGAGALGGEHPQPTRVTARIAFRGEHPRVP